jgi:hypothetical protein
MYIHSDVNEMKEKKNDIIKEVLTEEDLEKFYEERQSFFEESLLNNSKRTNTTKSTNYPSNKMKYKKQNFDNISFHKNILPENIISYEEYKSDNIINNNNNKNTPNKKSRTKRSFSYKNIKSINENNIEKDELKKEINEIQNKKNRNESAIKYSSFRDKNNINKGLNLENKNIKKDNQKIFQLQEKHKAISLFPRKMDNFKPSILRKDKEENENDKINISPIQTQSNNSNILTTKNSIFNTYNFETSQTKLNNNYKKDLNEVLYKRKDLENLDNKNNELNKKNNNNLNIYERNKLYSEKSKEKIKVLKQEIEKKEIEECSFYPHLTTDQNITNKFLNESNKKIDFYNKNLEWQKKINKSIRDLIVSNEKKTYEECSFHPNTNNKFSNEEIQNFKQPDFIYRKNINWMNKVNEKKKRYELEKMEEIKKEIELIQKENKKATQYLSEERRLMTYDDNLKELSKPKYITPKYTKKNIKRGNSVKNDFKNCDFEINNQKDFKEIQNLILSLKDSLQNNKKMNEKLFNENNNNFVMEIDKEDNINVISSPFDN